MALPKKIQDQRKDLVDKVVKDIEDGKPFFWDKGHYGKQPRNLLKAIKGEDKYYKGINAMQLAVAARVNGFKDSRWATFKQAEMAGGRVKKGAKGTHIEYWQYTQDVMELNPDTGERKKKQVVLEHPIVKSYVVFNGDQIEGIEKEQLPVIKQEDKNRNMENMIKNSEAKIFFDELSRNYYSSSKDEIHVIPREKFKNLDNFYGSCKSETSAGKSREESVILSIRQEPSSTALDSEQRSGWETDCRCRRQEILSSADRDRCRKNNSFHAGRYPSQSRD